MIYVDAGYLGSTCCTLQAQSLAGYSSSKWMLRRWWMAGVNIKKFPFFPRINITERILILGQLRITFI